MGNSEKHKLKALIIDDEISGRTMIEYYLKEFASDLFGELKSVSTINEAIKVMNDFIPNVIFTDYELRNETGLMITQHVAEDIPIVVVSAHSQYALEAIQTSVFDYLLKPLNESEILRFTKRLKEKLAKQHVSVATADLDAYLLIKDAGENIMIPYQDIVFIEAAGAYSKIVTDARSFIASKTLKSIENQLPKQFVRIHRSFIIPLNQIASYTSSIVCLKNGQQISLSKSGKKLLQSFL